jgi:hypothetical protein
MPHRNVDVVFRFARDSPLEGDGFEIPVPEREDRVSSLGLLLARDRATERTSRFSPVL